MAQLALENIKKSFGTVDIIKGVSLKVKDSEFIVFVGPSGCGKSTLLRMIAGLEPITSGEMRIDDQLCNSLTPVERGIAMVFQSYALYPHMTVAKNLGYGLRVAKVPTDKINQRVSEVAKSLQISHLLARLPKDLSGGQRQRVAIGRSMVREPKIFLFDEPLSNLDAALRVQTRLEIAKLHQQLKTTTIYVTHDQTEAMTLADRIVVLNGGHIAQVGSPLELYRKPQNIFVAGFIGSPKMNFLPVEMTRTGSVKGTEAEINVPQFVATQGTVTLGIRPEDMIITTSGRGFTRAELAHEEHMGEFRLLYLTDKNGTNLTAKFTGEQAFKIGQQIDFTFNAEKAHLFDGSGQRLSERESNITTTKEKKI